MTDKKDYSVPALERGLQVLALFSAERPKLSIKEITALLHTTTSQIYRTLYTLEKMQYLQKGEDKHYQLGTAVMHRAFCYLAADEITEAAIEPMRTLRDNTGATCHLAILSGTEAIYQFRVQSQQQLMPNFPIGTRLPAHRCAVGRVLLSGLPIEEIKKRYRNVTLDESLAAPPRSLPALITLLEQDSARKYTTNASHDAKAIAAPIVNYRGEIIAAINISSVHLAIEEEHIPKDLLNELLSCADSISQQFGGYGYFEGIV